MKWVAPMKKPILLLLLSLLLRVKGTTRCCQLAPVGATGRMLCLMLHSWGNIFCYVIMMMYFFQNCGNLKLIHLCMSPKLQIVISEHKTSVTIILTDRHTAALWLLRGVRTVRLLKRHVFFGLIGSQLRRIWQLLQFAKWSANTIWLLRV